MNLSSFRLWSLVSLIFLCASCTSVQTRRADGLTKTSAMGRDHKILIMDMDVELSQLVAGGIEEPKADWTQAAQAHVNHAVVAEMTARGANTTAFVEPSETAMADHFRQLKLLNDVVAIAIFQNEMLGLNLPTKKHGFDWTLGPGVKALRERFNADFALFGYVRDSYSSDGQVAMNIAMVLLGGSVQTGQQIGVMNLVDLNSGKVVWFNVMSSSVGDLRTADGASKAVKSMLAGMPL
jgi:hypothetical protein